MHAFIVTLREGIEMGLILGLFLGYINHTGRVRLRSSVFWGAGSAVFFSVVFALLFPLFSINEEAFEGITLWISAVLVASMLFWMYRNASSLKEKITQKISTFQDPAADKKIHLGLFLFAFFMIFREGVETVLFLGAIQLTTRDMSAIVGGMTGLVIAALFTLGIIQGSIRMDLKRFFFATTAVLSLFLVQIVLAGTHELAEAGLVPMTRVVMHYIGLFIRNEYLFNIGVILFPVLFLLLPNGAERKPQSLNPAEMRLYRHQEQWGRIGKYVVVVFGLSTTAILLAHAVSRPELTLSAPVVVADRGGIIEIPESELSDGKLHRYLWNNGDEDQVRFIVMKISENEYGTALDACNLCGSAGYVQENDGLICRNCAADLNPSSLGQSGGCNPIALASERKNGAIVISVDSLRPSAHLFEEVSA